MEYVGYIASLAMGITLGVMGGGGSILTVPILVYLFSISPTISTGYSLFVVGTTALFGSLIYVRRGEFDFSAVVAFALPSLAGVSISRGLIIPQIPTVVFQVSDFVLTKEVMIMATFALVMLFASFSMIRKRPARAPAQVHFFVRALLIGFVGLAVGIIAGFVGAGGGFLIIPALVFMAGLTMRVAVGTSLMIIAFQSLLGFVGDVSRGQPVDWSLLIVVTVFSVVGIGLGSTIAHKIKEQQLKPAFGWLILSMGTIIFFEQLRHLSVQ